MYLIIIFVWEWCCIFRNMVGRTGSSTHEHFLWVFWVKVLKLCKNYSDPQIIERVSFFQQVSILKNQIKIRLKGCYLNAQQFINCVMFCVCTFDLPAVIFLLWHHKQLLWWRQLKTCLLHQGFKVRNYGKNKDSHWVIPHNLHSTTFKKNT